MFLMWILIFKGLTARRLYKSFGVKGLTVPSQWLCNPIHISVFVSVGAEVTDCYFSYVKMRRKVKEVLN
jgi:hypothetical protein